MTARADRNKTLAGRLRDRIGCIDGWYNDASGELVSPLMEIAADVAELEAENATLRQQLADVTESMGRVEERCAKLRELAADAWCYISHPADASWTHKKRKEARDSLSDRMREMGVEVD